MSVPSPFQPRRGGNQKVTAGTTSASVFIGPGEKSLRIANASAVVIYFRTWKTGDTANSTASTTDTPVMPASAASSTLIIEKPQDHDNVAYVSDSGTSNVVHFQPGEGSS
jgi:hypothetical protein